MSGFHGAIAANNWPRISLPTDVSANHTVLDPADATATVTFKPDGTIVDHTGGSLGAWITPRHATIGNSYKVKFTRSSGSAFSSEASANDTYTIDISVDRSFSQTRTVVGSRACGGNWTIANLAETMTKTATGTVTATVEV